MAFVFFLGYAGIAASRISCCLFVLFPVLSSVAGKWKTDFFGGVLRLPQ